MINRRSFFRRFAAVVAVVALAPELAFRTTLEIPKLPPLDLQEMIQVTYDLARMRRTVEVIDVFTDASGVDFLKRNFPDEFTALCAIESSWPSTSGEVKVVGVLEQLRRCDTILGV